MHIEAAGDLPRAIADRSQAIRLGTGVSPYLNLARHRRRARWCVRHRVRVRLPDTLCQP